MSFLKSAPNARWVSLMGGDLSYEGDGIGHPVWRFSDGDAVGIFFFSIKPDLPHTHEMTRFVSEFEERVHASGARPVECSVLEVRGLPMVRAIVKVPQKPHGMTYLGSFTLPFARFSYVIKAQCEERGITGVREAVLFAEGFEAKTVTIEPESANPITGDWKPDSAELTSAFPNIRYRACVDTCKKSHGACALMIVSSRRRDLSSPNPRYMTQRRSS